MLDKGLNPAALSKDFASGIKMARCPFRWPSSALVERSQCVHSACLDEYLCPAWLGRFGFSYIAPAHRYRRVASVQQYLRGIPYTHLRTRWVTQTYCCVVLFPPRLYFVAPITPRTRRGVRCACTGRAGVKVYLQIVWNSKFVCLFVARFCYWVVSNLLH